jgi:NAD(P)H-quinone oxidoreductase subunit 2
MSDNNFILSAVQHLWPEIYIVIAILFASLWNLFCPSHKELTPRVCLVALIAAFIHLWQQFGGQPQLLFGGLFTLDNLTVCFGLIACLVGIIVILMSIGFESKFRSNRGEYYTVLMAAILSVLFLGGTTDLVMLFVSLETLTICCVMLSGFMKQDPKSNEASLKYLLSTAATTATFLYGLSFFYGLTGQTNYMFIHQRFIELGLTPAPSFVLVFAIVLVLSAIGFKLSMVPFHMWTPDVYEGAPTPVTAFLSVGAKLGGFAIAVRLLWFLFADMAFEWTNIIGVLAILSMIIGNIVALSQNSLKRMLAYSSIAHVGYILIGITAFNQFNPQGLAAVIFYLIIYSFMNLGAFTGAILIGNELGTDNINDLSGLIRKRPWLTLGLTVCLLNLAGLPIPPAGFFAKLFVFWAGMSMHSTLGNFLVGTALLTSVPAVYYYSRVAIKMIVREPSYVVNNLPNKRIRQTDPQNNPIWALTISIIGLIIGSIAVNQLMAFSNSSVPYSLAQPITGSLNRPIN